MDEYLCFSCGNRYEKFQGISNAPVHDCPGCGSDVKRLISGGTGFIMKGNSTA